MKPLFLFVWGVCLVVAFLLSACASNPKKGDACCSSEGAAPAANTAASSTAKTMGQGPSKAVVGASAPSSASGKVREHVSDSTQNEVVRETKPVIGDDSELRK